MAELAKVRHWQVPEIPDLQCLSIVAPNATMDSVVCQAPKLIYVERGFGRSRLGREIHSVSEGDMVFVPAGVVHGGTPNGDWGISLKVLVLPPTVTEDLGDIHPHVITAGTGGAAQMFRKIHRLSREGAGSLELETHLLALSRALSSVPMDKVASVENTRLRLAREILSDRCFESVGLKEIAQAAGLSRGEVCRAFAREYGMTPYAYKLAIRADRARAQIAMGVELGELSLNAGYWDQAHFSKQFRKTFGLSPRDYVWGLTKR